MSNGQEPRSRRHNKDSQVGTEPLSIGDMEIGAEPRYPTPCMLLTANTGVPLFGIGFRWGTPLSTNIAAQARAREMIEPFRL